MTRFRTHDVENQPPPLAPYDAWATDVALRKAGDGPATRSARTARWPAAS